MSTSPAKRILVLGASGLIGRFITDDSRARGFEVTGVARRFSPGQQDPSFDHELPIMSLDSGALTVLLQRWQADVVVNCLGVLQDGPGSDTRAVHRDFVARLVQAVRESGRSICLIHISVPGDASGDQTAFARTKREAEQLIAASDVHYAILRAGFVIAPSAYGGSALLRAIAALPFDLPAAESATPFQPVAVGDISATVAWLAQHGPAQGGIIWELMQQQPATLGDVVAEFRRAFGTCDQRRVRLPAWVLDLGTRLGDFANWLGWSPPMRTTAIAELRRGVTGDPQPWMGATGILPRTLTESVGRGPATIQDKWFARLYLFKAVMVASLTLFWLASGFIAVVISYDAAAAILASHGFPPALVGPATVGTSIMDMSVGALIAFRRTCAVGLIAGIVVSLGYMFGAAVLTPDLWIEPLGALVKTAPAIALMLVALMTIDNR
jgi:uncharacterized protein YbjT (DUF2867 family)